MSGDDFTGMTPVKRFPPDILYAIKCKTMAG